MAKNKTSLYLLSIVGIVAVVGIVVLILGNGNSASVSSTYTTEDLSGEAIGMKPDLVVTNLSLREFVETTPYAIVIEYTIRNKGIRTGKSFTLGISGVYTLSDGTVGVLTGSQGTVNIAGLKTGETFTSFVMFYPIDSKVIDTLNTGGSQDFKVAAKVDVDDEIAEKDETNNWYDTTITVTP